MNTVSESIDKTKEQISKLGNHIAQNPVPYIIGGIGAGCAIGYTIYSRKKTGTTELITEDSIEEQSPAEVIDNVVSEAADRAEEMGQSTTEKIKDTLEEKPLLVGAGALVGGLALGLLLPLTREENRVFGEKKKQIIEKAKAAVETVVEEGKKIARETIQEADQRVREAVKQTGETVREKVAAVG